MLTKEINKIYKKDFAVFILTYGRSDRVDTYYTLRRLGYKGRIVFILDDTDKTIDNYKDNYQDCEFYVFNKLEASKRFDIGDNLNDLRAVVYARNESFLIAEELGIEYFLELDDDYTTFNYRFDDKLEYCHKTVKTDLNRVFKACLNCFITTGVHTLALAQGGDYISGANSGLCFGKGLAGVKRKAMNSFFLSPKRKFPFLGRINEDVNSYVHLGTRGYLFYTTNQFGLEQKTTQTNSGGLTDIYLSLGTYVKIFYSVMYSPSCVKVNLMGNKNMRLHHVLSWKNVTPMIVSEDYKK